MPDFVLSETHAGIATIALNRPEARNAPSIALLDAMTAALASIANDESVRVLILAGAGKTFCAGADLNEVRSDEATIHKLLQRLSQVMRRLHRLPIPTIARVQGAAIGGGFGLMTVADFAVTHPEARIGYPPLETGLCPAVMAPFLVSKIGPAHAKAMLLLGGAITGAEAHDAGLVTHLAEEGQLAAATMALAEQLARSDPTATARMKRLLNELDRTVSDEALDDAARISAEVVASVETQRRLRKLFDDC